MTVVSSARARSVSPAAINRTALADQLSAMTLSNNLSDPTVMAKYRLAGDICNGVMRELLSFVKPGMAAADLCKIGDDLVASKCAGAGYKSVKKGLALPTCININNTVQHYAPRAPTGSDDDTTTAPLTVLKDGDLVKVELGVHIDGYACITGHTTVLATDPETPTTGPMADVITAAHFAAETAWRMIRPGQSSTAVVDTIRKIALAYGCAPVRGTFSARIHRGLPGDENGAHRLFNAPADPDPDADPIIIEDAPEQADPSAAFEFSVNEVYDMAIYLSTTTHASSGAVLVADPVTVGATVRDMAEPTLYTRNAHGRYQLRMGSSRKLLAHVADQYPVNVAALDTSLRFGLKECANHGLLIPRAVSATPDGTVVAAFRFTVLLLPSGQVLRLSLPHQQLPFVESRHELPADLAELLAIDPDHALHVRPVPGALPDGVPGDQVEGGGARRRSRSRKRNKSRGASVEARVEHVEI
ncbi:Proliferation-associated protein 2G4 [Allomyces javanicus]|nr:Proliferation-associated protein 2G4 [Allomyces javanicus]